MRSWGLRRSRRRRVRTGHAELQRAQLRRRRIGGWLVAAGGAADAAAGADVGDHGRLCGRPAWRN